MSVLRDRLTTGNSVTTSKPYGTGQTPMEMPLARVEYSQGLAFYDDLVPLWTGDVNAAPMAATMPGPFGRIAAAGRP